MLIFSLLAVTLSLFSLKAPTARAAGTITGRAFQDYNADGAFNTIYSDALPAIDVGVQGVTVTAYDDTGSCGTNGTDNNADDHSGEAGFPPQGGTDNTNDFGLEPLQNAVGNQIWIDGGNGTYDAGEEVGAGVKVELRNTSGTVVETTYTDENGRYYFNNVPSGGYVIAIPASNFIETGNPLFGINYSLSGAPDPDVDLTDNDDNGYPNGGDVVTQPFNFPASGNNLTIDFGFSSTPTAINLREVTAAMPTGDLTWIITAGLILLTGFVVRSRRRKDDLLR